MPDIRAVNALSNARASQRDRLRVLLTQHGYDPNTLDALPDPGDCTCRLAEAIREWDDINARLAVAESRNTGWRAQ